MSNVFKYLVILHSDIIMDVGYQIKHRKIRFNGTLNERYLSTLIVFPSNETEFGTMNTYLNCLDISFKLMWS